MSATEHPLSAVHGMCYTGLRCATVPVAQMAIWLALNCAGHALAQTGSAPAPSSPVITDADMDRARRAQVAPTDQDIERSRRQYSAPRVDQMPPDYSSANRAARSNTASPGLPAPASPQTSPDIGALPQPAATKPIDLGAIAQAYAANPDGPLALQSGQRAPGLLIFISMAMPPATLQRLVDQAARAQATLILRGLVNGSLRATVLQVQQLIGKQQASVQIDPQAFDRFAVVRVPAFVLVRDGTRPPSCSSGTCAPPQAFVRTAGDVSLDYALEHMVRAAPTFQRDAMPFLQRIQRLQRSQGPQQPTPN